MKENFYMNDDPDTAAKKALKIADGLQLPNLKKKIKRKCEPIEFGNEAGLIVMEMAITITITKMATTTAMAITLMVGIMVMIMAMVASRKVAEKLVDLISKDSNLLFKDQYGVPFANVFNTDHYEVIRIGERQI